MWLQILPPLRFMVSDSGLLGRRGALLPLEARAPRGVLAVSRRSSLISALVSLIRPFPRSEWLCPARVSEGSTESDSIYPSSIFRSFARAIELGSRPPPSHLQADAFVTPDL